MTHRRGKVLAGLFALISLLSLWWIPISQAAISPNIVISQVYGGGGNSGATLKNDYIELFNRGTAAVDVTGWSVQYASSTGSSWQRTILSGVIQPGKYYLVQEAAGTGGTTSLPTPDGSGSIAMSGTAGKVALVNNSTALTGVCPAAMSVDLVGYGGANCFEGSAPAPTLSNTTAALRNASGVQDTDNNRDDFTAGTPNPRNSGSSTPPPPPPVTTCEDPATHQIHQVQGAGAVSPLVGQTVSIRGIVVGDFQPGDGDPFNTDLGGFYVQEEQIDYDTDPLTSEGIFVSAPGAANVAVGDEVQVNGIVQESFGLTRVSAQSSAIVDCGDGVPREPVEVLLPIDSFGELVSGFERYEGMLVEFRQALRISEYFNFDRFGEIALCQPNPIDPAAEQDRLYQPTSIDEPGSPAAAARAEYNEKACITLDDARSEQNPDPARHPNGLKFTLENRFRGGDTVQNTVGILDYRFSVYRVQPTKGADYASTNPRSEQPPIVGGSLKVASFNVLNYFSTLDSGPDICGPARNLECRGADNENEFQRQRDKIIEALVRIDADIVGLIELENTDNTAIQNLVDGLNARYGVATYTFINTGTIGSDAIRDAFIYKPSTVTPVGSFAILTSAVDPRFIDTRNRPALAQTFENVAGERFTVAVNHFKSKGSDCGGAPDDDPQQGNCNGTRTLAAQALVDWLASDPTDSNDPDFLIIGDLNAYDKEDPIEAIRAGADGVLGTPDDYTDLEFLFGGEYAYGYLFDAQFGYLDYALAIQSLVPQVTGSAAWHINADEPDILDYDTTFKKDAQDALYAPDPFRSSDHDPVIVGLNLMPVQSVGKVTGGGTVSGGSANFSFNVDRKSAGGPIKGELRYSNPGGTDIRSVNITSLTISGNTAFFSGSCTNNGAPCMFTVQVQDNGEPGRNDTFSIKVFDRPTEGGRLSGGNIQVHKQK